MEINNIQDVIITHEMYGWINLSQCKHALRVLQIVGSDATAFLQSQATSDVLTLKPNTTQPSALLDRKAHVDAYFDLLRVENTYYAIAPVFSIPKIITRLETYVFTEDVQFQDCLETLEIIAILGPESHRVVSDIFNTTLTLTDNELTSTQYQDESILLLRKKLAGELGYLIIAPTSISKLVIEKLSLQQPQLSEAAWDVLQLEAGTPVFGVDFDHDTLLPATGLEQIAVSYTKGCYQGQEVVAKVRTYGSVGKVLTGLVFDTMPEETDLMNKPIIIQDSKQEQKEIGVFKRAAFSPTLNQFIALAYLNRDARVPGQKHLISINNQNYEATVQLLPFYSASSTQEKALALYDEALDCFAKDEETIAEQKLREALQLAPTMANAYESLGVILSRRFDRTQEETVLDEAIALMQRLHDINPDEVMAHTNLSVFYLKKGWKELAEDEKAKATMLGFKLAVQQKQQNKPELNLEAEKQKQLENKLAMFEQVLEFDQDDPLANYGLGQVLLDMGKANEAIAYLQKSTKLQPNHTLSYLALGQALDASGDKIAAKEQYQLGLEVASRKGDLMPLKQLQMALAQV